MSIIDKRVAIGRVNKDSTGQSHEIRFDRRVDGRGGVHVHSRKDITVLIRDDDRAVFFNRDDAGFLDQGSIVAFQYGMSVELEEQKNECHAQLLLPSYVRRQRPRITLRLTSHRTLCPSRPGST